MNTSCTCECSGESKEDRRLESKRDCPLSRLPIGAGGIISAIHTDVRGRRKFADVGILAGSRIRMEAHSPFGGLYRVRVLGASLAIQADMADGIMVSRDDGGEP